jgi:ribonuclease BN (tRNA processing enzyme)
MRILPGDNGRMRITVVGCAGSFPSAGSAASCYLLEAEGFRLVIDMGNGALGALQRYAPLFGIDAICLSHLHGDHCLDLGAYAVARQYYGPEGPLPPIPVYAPAGAPERLGPVFGLVADELIERFTFEQLTPGQLRIGPFRIRTAHVNHTVEAFGFRVEHDGWSMAYSADTGESAALVELARDVDLLLAEASFLDRPDNPAGVHLSGRQAGEHAAKAGAGHLVLTHLVATNDPAVSLAEAAGVFGGQLSLAAPGESYGPLR